LTLSLAMLTISGSRCAAGLGLATLFFLAGRYTSGKNLSSGPKASQASTATENVDTDDESEVDTSLSQVQAGFNETCKLILVVRTDLKMSSGKIAAQFVSVSFLFTNNDPN